MITETIGGVEISVSNIQKTLVNMRAAITADWNISGKTYKTITEKDGGDWTGDYTSVLKEKGEVLVEPTDGSPLYRFLPDSFDWNEEEAFGDLIERAAEYN